MRFKDRHTWIKHLDFILIDLICLIFAFLISYYLKMGRMFTCDDAEWSSLLVIICLINIVCMFLQSTYSGILKRRYYKQIRREISLLASQVATICVLFYALKIGAVFSREMMLVTYIIYFVASQPSKYLRKKYINKEYPFRDKRAKVNIIEEDSHTLALRCIDNRSSLYILFSSFIKRTIDIVGGLVRMFNTYTTYRNCFYTKQTKRRRRWTNIFYARENRSRWKKI